MTAAAQASARCGMAFWANVATFGPGAGPETLDATARAAEDAGFEALVVPDHLLLPASADAGFGSVIESVAALSFLAGRTERIRLGTSVMAAALRQPVLLAKQVAALDVLSGGRAVLGLAAGWSRSEFDALGVPFTERGRRTDEIIGLLRHLFAGSGEPFTGEFTRLAEHRFAPLPPQGAGLPILVGGASEAAYRRAARLGDAWHSATTTPEEFREGAARVRALAGDRVVRVGVEVRYTRDGVQGLRGTTPTQLADDIARWAEAGCDRMSVGFRPAADGAALLDRFCDEVLSRVGR